MPQLVVPKPLNPLDDVAQMLGIKQGAQNLQLQQQEIQKNQQAQQTAAMNADQQKQLQAIWADPTSYDPANHQPTSAALAKSFAIHPQLTAELMTSYQMDPKSLEAIANQQSEIQRRADETRIGDQTRQTAADTLTEMTRKNAADEKLKADQTAAKAAEPKLIKTANGNYQQNDAGGWDLIEGTQPQKKQTPGIDIPFSPEVQAQKIQIAAQEAAAKAKPAEVPNLDDYAETTGAGRQYINVAKLSGTAKNAMVAAAAKAGIPTVDKDGEDALSNIDTARDNLKKMNDTLAPYLGNNAGTRVLTGARNSIESLFQIDPNLSSVGTYRNAAIQAMRSVAGAKGLRINQAEIQMAIDNDIPKITDTAPVAKAKMDQMMQFLDNAEKGLIVQNRSSGTSGTPPAQRGAAPAVGGTFNGEKVLKVEKIQ